MKINIFYMKYRSHENLHILHEISNLMKICIFYMKYRSHEDLHVYVKYRSHEDLHILHGTFFGVVNI
jgi:hypothetical protein